jgi:hypothetical protein
MSHDSVRSLRLTFKRAFSAYFLALTTPAIADPTETFEVAHAYLYALRKQLGAEEFMRRLDDETTTLAGQIEQDLLRRWRGRKEQPDAVLLDDRPDFAELEDRLRECLEYGLARLDPQFGPSPPRLNPSDPPSLQSR